MLQITKVSFFHVKTAAQNQKVQSRQTPGLLKNAQGKTA